MALILNHQKWQLYLDKAFSYEKSLTLQPGFLNILSHDYYLLNVKALVLVQAQDQVAR